jgi:Protein of unknown function (DUF2911)/Protein of unknown function (DUF3347)
MKKVLIINMLCFLVLAATAQEPAKKSYPKTTEAAFTQQFGLSEIQVAYARPSARGRKIFGELVPFDSLWRTGANECTTIKFREEVVMGNKKIAAGKYSLFTIPSAEEWTIILNSETSMHGTSGYDAQKDVHRFKVKSEKIDRFYETFTIEINDFDTNGNAFLNLIWENTIVKIPLKNELESVTSTSVVKAETAAKADAHAGHDMSKMGKAKEGQSKDLKAQFAPVLSAYYGLKDALVADNAKTASSGANTLKTALSNIDTKDWTATQRNIYEPLSNKLIADAQIIADNASKIDKQRAQFDSLSDNLFTITQSLKINTETVYRQFCPMANDGKGAYWLSKENKVKNPYYGKSMLTCGSVKEILK